MLIGDEDGRLRIVWQKMKDECGEVDEEGE